MKVNGLVRVTCLPVHTAFPLPVKHRVTAHDFVQNRYPTNTKDGKSSSGFKVNNFANCIHLEPILVPHNNFGDGITGSFYNSTFPSLTWTINKSTYMAAIGDLTYFHDALLTWTPERAKALCYMFKESDSSTPDTKNDWIPGNNWLHARVEQSCQGFYMNLNFDFVPQSITWSGGVATTTFPNFVLERDCLFIISFVINNFTYSIVWTLTHEVEVYRLRGNLFESTTHTRGAVMAAIGDKIATHRPTGAGAGSKASHMATGHYSMYGAHGYAKGLGKYLEVSLVAGVLFIAIDDSSIPLQIPHLYKTAPTFDENGVETDTGGRIDYKITKIQAFSLGCKSVQIGASPMKFVSSATMTYGQSTSNSPTDYDIGIAIPEPRIDAPERNDVIYAHDLQILLGSTLTSQVNYYEETSASVSFSSNGNLTASYTLVTSNVTTGTYNGIVYGDYTPFIRAVQAVWAENIHTQLGSELELYPEEVVVRQTFNMDDLNIMSRATLTFNNHPYAKYIHGNSPFSADIFWGELSNKIGAMAIRIEMATEMTDDSSGQVVDRIPDSGWQTVFTGYGNLVSQTTIAAQGESKYVMECFGREIAMQTPAWEIPWMDIWNVYYAAATMASLGEVKIGTSAQNSDLAFFDKVPYSPYGMTIGDDYHLPAGVGGSPALRFPGGTSPWEVLSRFSKYGGYLRYFNEYGKFEFQKFRLLSSTIPYRTFTITDDLDTSGLNPKLNQMIFGGSVTRNLLDVRNHVILIGVNVFAPKLKILPGQYIDEYSIINPSQITGLTPTAPNFLGFRNRMVWSDSQFAEPNFAESVLKNVFNLVRLPPLSGDFQVWLQPDIFAGYRIGARERRSGLYDLTEGAMKELFCLGVTHRVKKGEVPTTSLTVKWIPPNTGQWAPI